jgi:hypothetical protein
VRVATSHDFVINVGKSPGASDYLTTTTNQTTVTLTGVPDGTYYARVSTRDENGTGSPTPDVSFTTGSPPNTPRDLTATVNKDSVTFSWSPAPAGLASSSYRIQVGRAAGASDLAVRDVTGTSTTLTNLLPDEYFARVAALNAFGSSDPTADRSFEIEPQSPPGPAAQLRPHDFSNLVFPELQWSRTIYTDTYEVVVEQAGRQVYRRVFRDDQHCDSTGNCNVASNDLSPGPFQDGDFSWSVRGINVRGPGPWSTTQFKVRRKAFPRPARLKLPLEGETVGTTPTLRWTSDERTNALLVVLTQRASGQRLEYPLASIRNCLGDTCTFQINPPLTTGRWIWEVVSGRSAATVEVESEQRSFNVSAAAKDQ